MLTRGNDLIFQSGELTIENIEEVANLINEMFGGKLYTAIEQNDYTGFYPMIKQNQRMSMRGNGRYVVSGKYRNSDVCFLAFNDTYGAYSASTNQSSNPDATIPLGVAPYVSINRDAGEVVIDKGSRHPQGTRVYLILKLEREK